MEHFKSYTPYEVTPKSFSPFLLRTYPSSLNQRRVQTSIQDLKHVMPPKRCQVESQFTCYLNLTIESPEIREWFVCLFFQNMNWCWLKRLSIKSGYFPLSDWWHNAYWKTTFIQKTAFSGNGEAFICQPSGTKLSPIKADSKKTNRSSSISPKTTESTLAQSPPTFSPFSNSAKEKGDTFAQSPPNTTPLSLLAKGEPKRDVVEYCLERIPFIHRGLRVFTDSKSRGFALLQIAAKEG